MDSKDFRALSGSATKVLMGLLRQYRGKNNGDLSAPFSSASVWGIGSKSTLAKALDELQASNLIIRTREGRFMKPGGCCALYAITWRSIDPCEGKIEVSPTSTPPRKFNFERSQNPVQKPKRQRSETVPMEELSDNESTAKGMETVPMEGYHLVQNLNSLLDIPGRSFGSLQSEVV